MNELTVPIRLSHNWRRQGERVVIISDANFNLVRHELNRVGSRTWELMDGKKTLAGIAVLVAAEHPNTARSCIDEGISRFIKELRSFNLATTREELDGYYGAEGVLKREWQEGLGRKDNYVPRDARPTKIMADEVDVLLLTTPRPPYLSPKAVQVSENSAPPLGLLCVAAALEQAGFRVAVHDFYQVGGTPPDVRGLIRRLRPRLVGVSALTSGIHLAYWVCTHAKHESPEIVTVLGGPHATALPEDVAAHPDIDFAVKGEGEETIVELARAVLDGASASMLRAVEGIAFKDEGKITVTPDRQLMRFDEAPLPARHLVPMSHYLQQGAIITSRGCTYRCWFCSSVTFNTHRYRYRSGENVLQEMDLLNREYGVTSFEFIEDTFTCDHGRVLELMSLLRQRQYEWSCQATIPDLNEHPELIPAMVDAGCRGLFFGIESGNNAVLRKIKHMSRRRVLNTIDDSLNRGVQHLVTSFIIGHPWDTRETIADTLSLILELRSRGAHTPVSILVPFPGSPIGKWPERFGVTVHSRDYSEYYYNRALISTRNLSREELADIYFEALDQILSSDNSPCEPRGRCLEAGCQEEHSKGP